MYVRARDAVRKKRPEREREKCARRNSPVYIRTCSCALVYISLGAYILHVIERGLYHYTTTHRRSGLAIWGPSTLPEGAHSSRPRALFCFALRRPGPALLADWPRRERPCSPGRWVNKEPEALHSSSCLAGSRCRFVAAKDGWRREGPGSCDEGCRPVLKKFARARH